MENEQKSGLAETFETGRIAAHTIRGAVKTGKAVSGVAKGAAAGPYGAAAGVLWENRSLVRKIVVIIAVLLMLPVIIIQMLPSLIFDGLSYAFSPLAPSVPMFNSGSGIIGNVNMVNFAINGIMDEGLEDVMARIEADFASSDADEIEIINPYATSHAGNADQYIAMYCAYKSEDYASISISDMVEMLRANKNKLFSYTQTEEVRSRVEIDPDTGKENTVTEKWRVYTIVYNGEDYFAEQVFMLSEEQMALANDYAQNLSLFLGDGMMQGISKWDGNTIPALGDVRLTDGVTEVVYYNQLDERYAGKLYGTDHIGSHGCGPTSMAMVVSSLTEQTIDPVAMAQWSCQNGYWCKDSGSYHALIPAAARNWGLDVSGCSVSEPQRILDALSEGKLVVAIMSKGHFTKSGHFIVLRGIQDGKILVADSASYNRSRQLWDLSVILKEASQGAVAGGPFWIIG
ncbi:MAG: C39 family peptidase [Acetatifactor sp.]|nr:C39 family peptidase [Acetatifactor sp.]